MAWLPLLALPLGYLLGWFLYGLAPLPLLVIVLGVASLLASLSGSRRGLGDFLRLLLLLVLGAGMVGLLIGGLMLGVLVTSPDNPLPFGEKELGLLLLVGVLVLIACFLLGLALTRNLRDQAGQRVGAWELSPAAPFLLMAGVLLFAFLPAVRVDCRGLQRQDSFLNYGSGFAGNFGQNYWSRSPERITDRAELPEDFMPEVVRVAATRCDYTGSNHWRPLSFSASRPLVIVYLISMDKAKNRAEQTFGAAFTPVTHEKRTPWVKVPAPYPYGRPQAIPHQHSPYRNPAWVVSPYEAQLPVELARVLK